MFQNLKGRGGGGMVSIVFCFEKKKFTFDRDKWFYASCDCLIMYFFSYQVGDRSVPAIPRRHFQVEF